MRWILLSLNPGYESMNLGYLLSPTINAVASHDVVAISRAETAVILVAKFISSSSGERFPPKLPLRKG